MVLGRLGFGSVAAGLWIAPAGVTNAVRSRLACEQLDGYVEFFTAQYADPDQLKDRVAGWWDLESLDRHYREFVDQHAPQRDAAAPPPREAFAVYVPLVTEWRQLPYLDPGLAAGLLPAGWHGRIAEDLFMRLHRRWCGPSRRHAEHLLSGY